MFDWIEKGSVAIGLFIGIIVAIKYVKKFFGQSNEDKINFLVKDMSLLKDRLNCQDKKIDDLEKKNNETAIEFAKIFERIDYIIKTLQKIEEYIMSQRRN